MRGLRTGVAGILWRIQGLRISVHAPGGIS